MIFCPLILHTVDTSYFIILKVPMHLLIIGSLRLRHSQQPKFRLSPAAPAAGPAAFTAATVAPTGAMTTAILVDHDDKGSTFTLSM
jgi:hypothetical protein